jgi:hypothetical protein
MIYLSVLVILIGSKGLLYYIGKGLSTALYSFSVENILWIYIVLESSSW